METSLENFYVYIGALRVKKPEDYNFYVLFLRLYMCA